MEFITTTLICVKTTEEKVLELIDYYTARGEIVMLSCFNILDEVPMKDDSFLEMDKEKIGISDKLIVFGEDPLTDSYVNALVEHAIRLGKNIQYVEG